MITGQGKTNYTNEILIGTVVNTKDPIGLGRIQVRIPYMHKFSDMKGALKDENLPWVSCGSAFPIQPDIGSKVYIFAENGDTNNLVYFGIVHRNEICQRGSELTGSVMYNGEKFPSNLQYEKYKPYRTIIADSAKGDSIYIEKEDEKETVGIIDRVGNWYKSIAPVLKSANSKNSNPKINSFSNIAGGTTGIFLRTVGTGVIQLTESGSTKFIASANNNNISITDKIALSVGGSASIEITSSGITLSNGTCSISINGSNITLTNGSVSIKMGGNITVEDASMVINGATFTVNAATSLAGPAGASPAGAIGPVSDNPSEIDKNF